MVQVPYSPGAYADTDRVGVHRYVAANDVEKALQESRDFLYSKEVLVVKDGLKLPGFRTVIDQAMLGVPGAVTHLMGHYPQKVTMREHLSDWGVSDSPMPSPRIHIHTHIRMPSPRVHIHRHIQRDSYLGPHVQG